MRDEDDKKELAAPSLYTPPLLNALPLHPPLFCKPRVEEGPLWSKTMPISPLSLVLRRDTKTHISPA
jgi:hypothetical protein